MGSVGTPVVRRMIDVAHGPHRPDDLLASVGLAPEPEGPGWAGESVDQEAYYGLIERIAAPDDHDFPFRYADALRADDLGAMGLAVKTAPTLGGALERLARYILVLTDTLEYELVDAAPSGRTFTLNGRPHHRRGAAIANECALAAVTSVLRQAAGTTSTSGAGGRGVERVEPVEVTFRHAAPAGTRAHRDFFGCAVSFDAPIDGLRFDDAQLERPTALADDGLSAYLLGQLDELKARATERSLVDDVRAAIADALPDGQPSKSRVARRLGMSERTLHRRLADHGETFQTIATEARREAAESLLRSTGHSLADVAFLTGFADQSAFTRAFRRWTGMTPAAFRAAAG